MQIDPRILDEQLRNAILALYAADKRVAAGDLRVGVLNGVVHLAGMVESRAVRTAAEDIARKLPGVVGVVNRIEAPGAPSPTRTINLNLKKRKS